MWHKTTRERAKKILSTGFDMKMRGKGAFGGKTDIVGISFGTKSYSFSDEQLAYEISKVQKKQVRPSDIVKLSGTVDVRLYKARGYGRHSRRQLMRKGYEGILYPSGEVVLFSPDKVKFDLKTQLLRYEL